MKKDPQQVAQNKRAEQFAYENKVNQSTFENNMAKARVMCEIRLECVKAASAFSEGNTAKAIEAAQALEKYVSEPVKDVTFTPPKVPTVDSNIKLLD